MESLPPSYHNHLVPGYSEVVTKSVFLQKGVLEFSTPDGTRIQNPLIKTQVPYPVSHERQPTIPLEPF